MRPLSNWQFFSTSYRSQGLLPQQWVDAARLHDAGVLAHSLVAALRRVGGVPSRVPGGQVRGLGRVQERAVRAGHEVLKGSKRCEASRSAMSNWPAWRAWARWLITVTDDTLSSFQLHGVRVHPWWQQRAVLPADGQRVPVRARLRRHYVPERRWFRSEHWQLFRITI